MVEHRRARQRPAERAAHAFVAEFFDRRPHELARQLQIDSSLPSPLDLVDFAEVRLVSGATQRVQARSVVVLFAGMLARG